MPPLDNYNTISKLLNNLLNETEYLKDELLLIKNNIKDKGIMDDLSLIKNEIKVCKLELSNVKNYLKYDNKLIDNKAYISKSLPILSKSNTVPDPFNE